MRSQESEPPLPPSPPPPHTTNKPTNRTKQSNKQTTNHPSPPSAESRLPSCKIRLGTNGETSRVSTGKFTVSRHKNRGCKYMEDMYCDNDCINMTPTRCSVLITFESGDALISLRGQCTGRAEHIYYNITERKNMYHERSWLVSSTLDPLESRVRTGLCGRSYSGLRTQQSSLVGTNGLLLLPVSLKCCSQRVDT